MVNRWIVNSPYFEGLLWIYDLNSPYSFAFPFGFFVKAAAFGHLAKAVAFGLLAKAAAFGLLAKAAAFGRRPKGSLINQAYHHLDFVELVHADFVFLLLARHNKSKLLFCSCFVRRFGIAHASMALRSLSHNLDHHIFSCSLYNLNSLKLIMPSCEVSNCSAPE